MNNFQIGQTVLYHTPRGFRVIGKIGSLQGDANQVITKIGIRIAEVGVCYYPYGSSVSDSADRFSPYDESKEQPSNLFINIVSEILFTQDDGMHGEAYCCEVAELIYDKLEKKGLLK